MPSRAAQLGGDITSLLQAIAAGDRRALDRLFGLVYGELHGLARRRLGARSPRSTLQTTALVHETYLKLAGSAGWSAGDRAHFFALAGRAMRQIVIDHARRRLRDRRGGRAVRLSLDEMEIAVEESAAELVALDAALDRLRSMDGELAQLVEWRFFAGRSLDEIAEFTGVSTRTLKRRWRAARAFLYQELTLQGIVE
jgi:RNA polymerase sigma factor (TIGR02999 family)